MINLKYFKIFLLASAICFLNHSHAYMSIAEEDTSNPIDDIISAASNYSYAGILIKSLDDENIVYQKNADRFFMPASTLKVFTAAAALTYLDTNYTFTTNITTNNLPENDGVINGNLYIKFTGDPTLTKSDFAELFATLQSSGITTINGNIYIDDFVFDQDKYGTGWMWNELDKCYAAPTTGIMLDKNCFWINIHPAKTKNHSAHVVTDDPIQITKILNQVLTKRNISASECPLELRVTEHNEYIVDGCINIKSESNSFHAALKNPRLYLKKFIPLLLQNYNIKFHGKIIFTPVTKNNYVLASHSSEPLTNLIKTMLKHSDNLIADALFKTLGHLYFNKTASWQDGALAIKKILAGQGINLTQAQIYDGSGLSRYDLISPKQMLQVLSYVYRNPNIAPIFIDSLPVSGIDGSLHWRMRQDNTIGKIRAKTGTMTGISGLAGYINTDSNKTLGFVILFNTIYESHRKFKQLEDRICSYLCGF